MDNQHIASNLTVRVSHDLLKAGAMCRVSNTLGVSEKHIQLVGECQALLSVPGAPSSVSPPPWPRRRLCRAAVGRLSSVSFPALPDDSIRKGQSAGGVRQDTSYAHLQPGEGAWLLALHCCSPCSSPCQARRQVEALAPAVGKLPACPQRGHQGQLLSAQTCWARKQRDGWCLAGIPVIHPAVALGAWQPRAEFPCSYRNCPNRAFLY